MATTVQYDLDTSGGLMDEIQALIAPPLTDEPSRKTRRIEREPRRTGRATNRDCCDSCREGGDLICCDRCPASFHLQCCNPPLEEEQLPTGDWICHKCRVAPEHIEKTDAELITAMTIPKSITGKDGAKTIERQSGDYFKPRKVPVRLNDRLRRDGKQCMRLAQLQAYKEAQKEMKKEPADVVKATTSEPDEDDMEDILQNKGNPFVMLIKAAAIQNPDQFQLPAELMTHAPLPGTTRKRKKDDVAKNYKKIHELENGMVPLPAKVCFHCNKSCRVDPLIQCDYCPLLFHRDCLSPPLTTFPTGRWMCPNHPENGLPEFAKASYTERCKIYHDINNRLNQHAVKLDFLNKVHATGLPWAEKPTRRKSAEIPSAVKAHYRCPPPLLAQPIERRHCTTVALLPMEGSSHKLCSPEEQEEWLQTVVGLQSSIAVHLAKQGLPKSEQVTQKIVSAPKLFTKSPDSLSPDQQSVHHVPKLNDTSSLTAKREEFTPDNDSRLENSDVVSRIKEITGHKEETKEKKMEKDLNLVNGPRTMWNGPYQHDRKEKYDGYFGDESQEKESEERDIRKPENWSKVEENAVNSFKSNGPQEVYKDGKPLNSLSVTSSQSLKTETKSSVQSNTSASLAGSIQTVSTSLSQNLRVSTITVPSRPMVTTTIGLNAKAMSVNNTIGKVTSLSLSTSLPLISLNNTLQSCIEGSMDAELSKLDEKLIKVLAWQRLQQLMPSKVSNSLPTKDTSDNSSSSEGSSTQNHQCPVLASLCPVASKGSPRLVHMRRKCIIVGNNSDADVCLSHYGHCNFSSTRHASIFYDEASRQFELINYSEFGTTVDKVRFTGEVREKTAVRKPPSSLVKSVRKVSSKSKVPQATVVKPEITFLRPCNCKGNNDVNVEESKAGWEGTALLHHGSMIEFGCLQFVFSVTDATLLPTTSKIRL